MAVSVSDKSKYHPLSIWEQTYPILCLMVLVFLWLGGFTDGFIGHPYGDMPDHVWGNEWFAQELRQGRWPTWVTDNHFPTGGVLWHIDPLGGLFRRAFLFLPPHWIWNVYMFVLVFGFSWTVHLWSIRLGASRHTALLLSILSVFNPYMSGLIHSGLTEYMGLGFGVLFVLHLREERWFVAGLWLMILGVQSFVVGLIASLFGAIHLSINTGIPKNKDQLWVWIQVVLPSICVVIPFGVLCLQTLQDPNALFTQMDAPGWNFGRLPAVDLAGFIPPGDWLHPDTREWNPGIVQNHSLGWGWTICILFGLYTSTQKGWDSQTRPWIVFSIFAMGPRLSLLRWMPMGGGVLLPLAAFYMPYSPFRWVHHPYHLVMFVWIASIPIVVLGVKSMPKWVWLFIVCTTGAEVVNGSVPAPFVRTQFQEDVSVEGPRFDFPPDQSTANRIYLIQQLRHGEPIAYAINRWMPTVVFEDAGMQRWLKALEDPVRRSQNRDQPPQPLKWLELNDRPTRLGELGFDWLIVHLQFLSISEQEQLRPLLDSELGIPSVESNGVWVYPLSKNE